MIGTLTNLIANDDKLDFRLGDSLKNGRPSEFEQYDLIMSHLPFGRAPEIYDSKYKTVESLFVSHILERMENNGIGFVIVPPNFLFDKSRNTVELRKKLLTQCNLHTILCLPSGSFKPYTGIPANVLFFQKGKPTNEIWYYEVVTDKPLGRKFQLKENDFAEFIALYEDKKDSSNSWTVNIKDLGSDYVLTPTPPSSKAAQADVPVEETVAMLHQKESRIKDELSGVSGHLEQANYFLDLVASSNSNRVRLGELIRIKTGQSLSRKHILDNGPFQVYGGNGMIGYYDSYNRNGEYILIGRVGALCGNIHSVNGKIWLTQNAMSAEIIADQVYIPYLEKLLVSLDLGQYGSGTCLLYTSPSPRDA